jgi:SAM-dependent methyltransferase
MTQVYRRPDDYDFEHLGDDDDISFYCRLSERLGAKTILELGCGTGRITFPLAELGSRADIAVTGLDSEAQMLAKAQAHLEEVPPEVRKRLTLTKGDMQAWKSDSQFDLILVPCASLSHILALNDQLAIWRTAYNNLRTDGRFVVEVAMPSLATFADSFSRPPRVLMETDLDVENKDDRTRLLRHKTTQYQGHEQRASIRFMYEKIRNGRSVERYIDDFQSHVYFPRELELIFLHSGFRIDTVYGDYRFRPLKSTSPVIIMIGRKPTAQEGVFQAPRSESR